MKCRQSSAYRLLETLRDEFICPMVDRIPGTLSAQCIGQQIMLDIMDAVFQLSQALYSPKGEPRLGFIVLVQKRLEDLQTNVGALRARTKMYEKLAQEDNTKHKAARIITAKQYSTFLEKMAAIYVETEAMRKSNEEHAAKAAAAAPREGAAGTRPV